MQSKDAAALRAQILELTAQYADLAHQPKPFEPGASPVPVSGKVYGASELMSLVDSSLDFWLTTGRFNDSFEIRLAAFIGARRKVLTVNSGSSANLVALTGLTSHLHRDRALKPGDEVITTATGFPTTVNPVMQNGLVPVFVDVDIPTYNIMPSRIEEAVTDKTRAIMVAHTLGNPFALSEVMRVAQKYNLWVIEDCCDALGATYDGKMVGTFGDVGTLSFYPAHHITMGEGGAVFTANSLVLRAMESIRDWGRDCYCPPGVDNTCKKRFGWNLGDLPFGYDHKYTYSHLGYNLKITDMQAAVGLAQMDRLDSFIEIRRSNFQYLNAALSEFTPYLILPEATPNSEPSWFGYVLTLREDAPFSRDQFVKYLNEHKIATRLLFGGNLIRQPYMKGRHYRVAGELTNADIVVDRTFWIGVYPGLSRAHLDYVVDVFRSFIRQDQAPATHPSEHR
ncbi:lipopolysaccharide biosynthesis protein RfbH [Methylobacterium sp. P1-11]|uniref:lipopolysaccharide biosynthesis protein RfbH n=1 Tax=Methylobacterium sp. P1-11 TaxID=2024616 RepID=UPI0011EE4C73|nr:lipopolysaccharide biosynthesis protein RfbH [Methylobacterium sp. P1-11]KAA0110061.1 lipopolysaccharide biosynthesis protein RfbH [Methylobacterium sp. P1-11]